MNKLIVLALCFVVLATTANAAWYAKFDGVDGESTDAHHDKWSDMLAINHVIKSPSSSSARVKSAEFGDVIIVKSVDKSTPKLQEAVAKGKVFPKVEIHGTATYGEEPQTYYAYELKNVRITSYSLSGDADDRPTEEIALNFEEYKVEYKEYDDAGVLKGIVQFLWNVVRGR